jgi:hypothetical protein
VNERGAHLAFFAPWIHSSDTFERVSAVFRREPKPGAADTSLAALLGFLFTIAELGGNGQVFVERERP